MRQKHIQYTYDALFMQYNRNNSQNTAILLPCFLVRRMDPAPIAKLVQFNLPRNGFFVLPGMIIDVLAGRAAQPGQLFFKL